MDDFKEFERKAWEDKASRYDASWGRVSNQVIHAVLKLSGIKKGEVLLDCGSGPGHLCKAALDAGAIALGCDYSEKMVEIARLNYPEIEFEHSDAEALNYAKASFDVITMNFLLLHVANQEAAIAEAARCLKPKGRLVFSLWSAPPESPGLSLMFSAAKQFADFSVIPPAQDIFMLTKEEVVKEMLSKYGFKEFSFERLNTYWKVDSKEDFFNSVQAGTRIGGLIDLQSSEIKEKIRQEIFLNLEKFKEGGHYIVPTPSLIVKAVMNG